MSSTRTHTTARLAGVAGAAVLATLALPGSASAHVQISADSTAAGSYAVLTLAVPHGCDGSPTTRLTVQVPPGLETVTPTVHPGWTISKRTEKLAEPVTTRHGKVITERVAEVVWTARTPLPEGYRDTLSMQVPLPADAAGRVLAFPTLQTCAEGETAWTQVPAEGQDADGLEHPAPVLTVTAADAAHHHAAPEPGAEDPARTPATTLAATPATTGPDLVGPALGALGLAAGLAALARTRGARTRPDQG